MPQLPASPSHSHSTVHRDGSKPVRLRTACNQCCSAKVKCSGERSGCERCRNLHTECIYSESRVGKVPGIRARKRQEHCEQRNQVPGSYHRNSCVTTTSSSNSSSLQGDTNESMRRESLARWSPEASIGLPDNDDHSFLTSSSANNVMSTLADPIMASMSNDLSVPAMDPSMDFNLDSFMHTFPTPAPEPLPLATPVSTPTRREKASGEDNSRIVIDCTQVISDLENYLVADLKSFKIVLSLVKRALEKVAQLGDTQQNLHSSRSVILLVAIMEQIIELMEVCFNILTDETIKQRDQGFGLQSVSNMLLPGLGSGDFGLDAEEQNAWRSRMVSREIREAMEVVRKLKRVASLDCAQPGGRVRSRSLWFEELELRLTDLMGRVARI